MKAGIRQDRALAPGLPCQPSFKALRDAEVHLTACRGTLLLAQVEPHPSLLESKSLRPAEGRACAHEEPRRGIQQTGRVKNHWPRALTSLC